MQVWEVLTDYEKLPEVVPNLAVCDRIDTPSGMSRRVTRLRQVRLTVILLARATQISHMLGPHIDRTCCEFKQYSSNTACLCNVLLCASLGTPGSCTHTLSVPACSRAH